MSWLTLGALNDISVVAIVLLGVGLIGWAFKSGWIIWGNSHRSEIAIYAAAAERDAKTIESLLNTNAVQATTAAEWNVAGQLISSQSAALRDALERK